MGPRGRLRHCKVVVGGEGGVVVHDLLAARVGAEHTAVAVVGELVEAGVGHDHEVVAHFFAHGGQGPVKDAVGRGSAASGGVLVRIKRDAEEHDPAEPGLDAGDGLATNRVDGVLDNPGQRGDVARCVEPIGHERGQHELAGLQRGLPHESTHRGRIPQTSRSDHRGGRTFQELGHNCHSTKVRALMRTRFSPAPHSFRQPHT